MIVLQLRSLASRSIQTQQRSILHPIIQLQKIYLFSTKDETTPTLTKKQLEKERRKKIYEKKMARAAALPFRRDGKPKDVKRNAFHSWFDKKMGWEIRQDKLARKAGKEWKMKVAVIVERLPVIMPEMPVWEKEFLDLKLYLQQFGKQYPPDTEFGQTQRTEHGESIHHPKTFEDLFNHIPEEIKATPRTTIADKTNDTLSLNRKLDTRLYYVSNPDFVRHEDDLSPVVFPTAELHPEETFSDAAKRIVQEEIGEGLVIWYLSNCPMAVHMEVYPSEEATQFWGEKTFFMRVQRQTGDAVKSDDYAWLDRGEVVDSVKSNHGDFHSKFYHYLL